MEDKYILVNKAQLERGNDRAYYSDVLSEAGSGNVLLVKKKFAKKFDSEKEAKEELFNNIPRVFIHNWDVEPLNDNEHDGR